MRLQDKAEAAITRIDRYQKQLESAWVNGQMAAIKANIKLIERAAREVKDVLKEQLYDNVQDSDYLSRPENTE